MRSMAMPVLEYRCPCYNYNYYYSKKNGWSLLRRCVHYHVFILRYAFSTRCASLELIVETQLKPACTYTIQDGRREGVGLGSVLGLVLGLV